MHASSALKIDLTILMTTLQFYNISKIVYKKNVVYRYICVSVKLWRHLLTVSQLLSYVRGSITYIKCQ